MNKALTNRDISIPEDWDRSGLPGWCYHSEALLELERDHIFRTHWQIVCHVSNIPDPGDYMTFDLCGERALVVRGQDGQVRGFHNICRHRGSRVVADEQGSCKGALVCPFHGWVYNLDGTLRGAAQPKTFPDLDKDEFGLKPVELEIWNGLVFIRFFDGPQPSVAEIMKPVEKELATWRAETMVPDAEGIWSQVSDVNWKSVRDVDNEGYHVALAHPALQDLYGRTYKDEPFVNGVSRSIAWFKPDTGRRWSVRNYTRFSEPRDWFPEEQKTAWVYFGLFPNAVIWATPETFQFYQEMPLTTTTTMLRAGVYHYKDETRRQKAARYLGHRIDRETLEEDVQLTIWSNESMQSKAFEGFYLSDLEYTVRTHHDHLRDLLPVYGLEDHPGEEEVARANEILVGR